MPMLLTLGVGKSASAHVVQSGAAAYAEKGYQYVSRKPDCLINLTYGIGSTTSMNARKTDLQLVWL